MTTTQTNARRRPTPFLPADRRPTAEQVLRDAAYVLHLTRKVRDSILSESGGRATVGQPTAPAMAG